MPLATPLEIMPRDTEVIGWSGSVLRTTVVVGELSVPIGFVHLRSVRNELSEFLDLSELPAQADSMASRLRKRVAGSMTAAEWLAEVPLVVGDFNLVPESPVFRRDWGKYHSAWGVAGVGTGRTWASRWFGLRIDHVMAREPVRTSEVHIGNGFGSDHRPVIAELRIRD
jgi:endonuclease/exonuclease/phosphatase family metal-dependent hydrolase